MFSRNLFSVLSLEQNVIPVSNASFRKIPKEFEKNLHRVTDPAIAHQRSRHGSVLWPRRDLDLDYSSRLLDSIQPLNSSS